MSTPERDALPHTAALLAALAPACDRTWDSYGIPVLELRADRLLEVVDRLRDEFGYALFLDVTAVDHPSRQPRFDVVYHFLRPRPVTRVRLKVQVSADDPTVPTLVDRYGAARYMEREAHDMFGIRFAGNDDLRPILLYEGFVGHPLRKDYPMEREQPIVDYRKAEYGTPGGQEPPERAAAGVGRGDAA
jgi:NADH-quinone oxidoreductase subunit C